MEMRRNDSKGSMAMELDGDGRNRKNRYGDEPIEDDRVTDSRIADNRPVEDRVANDRVENGQAANGLATNGLAANEQAANEQAANEQAANEQAANEQPANEQAADDWFASDMKTETPGYQLKVLSGRHTGVIMPLPPGRYSLGQDEKSDFIFVDDAFLGGQLIVDVTGKEPTLELTGQVKATLDGQELAPGTPSPLPDFQTVEVGTTRFAIGPSHLAWPEIAVPKLPEAQPAADAPAGTEGESAQPSETAAPGATPEGGEGQAKEAKQAAGKKRLILILSLTLGCLAAAGGLWVLLYPRKTIDQALLLKAILAEMNLPQVRLERAPEGYLLKGFVRSDTVRDSLSRRLAGLLPPVKITITSEEDIRSAIMGILEVYHLEFAIEMGRPGKAIVTGVMGNAKLAKEISDGLHQVVPPETELELRIYTLSEVYEFLNDMLSAHILDHKVQPMPRNGRMGCILIKRQMDSTEMQAWNEIRDAFRTQFSMNLEEYWTDRLSPVLVRFQNVKRILDTQLVGVTVGEMSHISLRGRRKYFVGARLGGITLKSIQRERILLGLDQIEQTYFLKKAEK